MNREEKLNELRYSKNKILAEEYEKIYKSFLLIIDLDIYEYSVKCVGDITKINMSSFKEALQVVKKDYIEVMKCEK